ncbi:MAG TPA: Asp-tRNA(Asn)/Glu-tRNA(Gln) amidotransferase subunit GatA [Longimicrobiales bacterium]
MSSAVERIKRVMQEIVVAETGPNRLNAFLSYQYETAVSAAEDVDSAVARGELRELAGLPVAVKDNICTLDLPTTCASRLLSNYRSPFEATVVQRLRAAGAIVVAKTNLDEFAMGSTTENSAFGATRNPRDLKRIPGGSSGGSAAAVAAGIVPVALGSETGGSVRQPASFCGVVGVKPSHGRVSRFGLVAFASSLDCVGVFGRTVKDAAHVTQIISGHDAHDATTLDQPVPDLLSDLDDTDMRGLVVGVPAEYFPDDLDPEVAAVCRQAIAHMKQAGVQVRDVSLPHARYAIPTYYVIATAEASSNLARYDGVRYGLRAHDAQTIADVFDKTRSVGFGPEVKRRIMLGTYVLAAGYHEQYYARAQRVRSLIARDVQRVFDSGVDVLFTPTTPTVAFEPGVKADPYELYLSDIFTVTANLAAIPAISVPIGTAAGMPVGGQLMARRWDERTLFRAAAGLEALP